MFEVSIVHETIHGQLSSEPVEPLEFLLQLLEFFRYMIQIAFRTQNHIVLNVDLLKITFYDKL